MLDEVIGRFIGRKIIQQQKRVQMRNLLKSECPL
jgi:hypothetical protein